MEQTAYALDVLGNDHSDLTYSDLSALKQSVACNTAVKLRNH